MSDALIEYLYQLAITPAPHWVVAMTFLASMIIIPVGLVILGWILWVWVTE